MTRVAVTPAGARSGGRILFAFLLLLGSACSPEGPREAPVPGEETPAVASTASGGTPRDRELDWAVCEADPIWFEDCRHLVRKSRADPSTLPRLEQLAASRPHSWIPRYLVGYCKHRQGDHAGGREGYLAAADLARAAGDPFGEATALYALDAVLRKLGETDEADRTLEEALRLARLSGDRSLLLPVLYRAAMNRDGDGRHFDAREAWEELLGLVDTGRNEAEYRRALYAHAANSRWLGRHDEAVRGFQQVLELARESDDHYRVAYASMALGILALDTSDQIRAGELFDEAATAAARSGLEKQAFLASVLSSLALIREGRYEKARSGLEAEVARAASMPDEMRFRHLVYLADVERLSGREDSALDRYRRIREMMPGVKRPELSMEALTALASLHRHRGEWDAAIEVSRRAESMVESMRSNIDVLSERTHFLHIRSNAYQILAGALARRDPADLAEPFALLERVHARTLRELLSASGESRGPVESSSLSAVQRRLAPRDLLVEFLLGEEESSLLAVDARSASHHALPPRRELEERIGQFRAALLRPLHSVDARLDPEADFRRFGETGYRLFHDLLGPVADRLDEVDRLIIIPDRRLHLLPFEALMRRLPEPGRPLDFLGASHAVAYLPAAALLTPAGDGMSGPVLVVSAASGRADLDLAPLRHAAAEAQAVASAYPEDRVERLEGNEASLSRVLAAISRPREILHVTAHGLLDPAQGPRIVLHDAGDERSWLGVEELAGLTASPRLVILSACDTARGELVGGEGILGLVRSFTLAGSRQIVASLWVVDDARTAAMMGRVHRELSRGALPSEALRAARQETLQDGFLHPFYWAGLVLYGSD